MNAPAAIDGNPGRLREVRRMAWSDAIDIYCERTDPAFWAEPVNALSNLGFLVAAGLAYRHWRRSGTSDIAILGLIVLVALIGIGSFLFHTIATRAVSLVDVIPITIFVFWYLYLALRRFLNLSTWVSIGLLAGFAALSEALSSRVPAELVNGSDAYLPPLAALVAIGVLTKDPARRRGLLLSATIFAASLGFRTIDLAACSAWPLGTHFIWHLVNALLLYRLVETTMAPASTGRSGRDESREGDIRTTRDSASTNL
jgi:hypothetical protein